MKKTQQDAADALLRNKLDKVAAWRTKGNFADVCDGLPVSARAGSAIAAAQAPKLEVARGFEGKTVLLTGVTGYLGELILEQLLRVCRGARKVYVVVRKKKGQTGTERVTQLLHSPLFHMLHAELEEHASKIQVIESDIAELVSGLSPDLRTTLLRSVNYIIHCAAAIRFDLPTSAVIRENYVPTRDLLNFASDMEQLECFTFLSTAFVNAHLGKGICLEERMYPLIKNSSQAPRGPAACACTSAQVKADDLDEDDEIDGYEMGERLSGMPDAKADQEGLELMRALGIKNTYFLIKNFTERMVLSYDGAPFPVCILRPSIVSCVAAAPYPGFIGNTSGLTGCLMGMASGIGTFTQHHPQSVMPAVPGDLVSSATLAATVAIAHQRGSGLVPHIIHVCSSDSLPLRMHQISGDTCRTLNEHPRPSRGLRRRHYTIDHVLSDAGYAARSAVFGAKIRATAAVLAWSGDKRNAMKLRVGWQTWQRLCSSEHDYDLRFQTYGAEALQAALCPEERQVLKCVWGPSMGDSWDTYMRTYMAGVRHLLLREPPPKPNSKHKFLAVAAAPSRPLRFAELADRSPIPSPSPFMTQPACQPFDACISCPDVVRLVDEGEFSESDSEDMTLPSIHGTQMTVLVQ